MNQPKVDATVFWKKVRATVGLLPFVGEIVAVWYAAQDPVTPLRAKAIILGAVAYFVLPFDILPDFMVGLGYVDDLAVLTAALRLVRPYIGEHHREKARAVLRGFAARAS